MRYTKQPGALWNASRHQTSGCVGLFTVTVTSISSVTSGTLALELLASQRDTLSCGVTVVVPSVAGVDQLWSRGVNYRREERQTHSNVNTGTGKLCNNSSALACPQVFTDL